ncbi:S8 family serine peptidase [Kocuria sp. M1N1S27]|uniref:S8 family serine peptidase n=1 Tax=Kocuria kalidii TaxID=3376283 RepID=UPI003799E6FC
MKKHRIPPFAIVGAALLVALPTNGAFAEEAPAPPDAVQTAPENLPTDRMIVKYAAPLGDAQKQEILGTAAEQADVPEAEDTTELKTTADGADVVELTDVVSPDDAADLAQELEQDPAVAYAEPDQLVFTAQIPGMDDQAQEQLGSAAAAAYDADAPYMWALNSLGAPRAWDTATGRGMTIGVVDTGFANHPDLDLNVIGGWDFVSSPSLSNDGNGRDSDARDPGTHSVYGQCWAGSPASKSIWHGTHVAGTAAARRDAYGVVGIAPDATLLNARALGACGTGYVSDMADSVTWLAGAPVAGVPAARKRADVINMSLSMYGSCPVTLQNAINTAWNRGIPVAVAAGNNGQPAINYAPGNCYNVVTVGAVTSDRTRASYSNHGAAVDIYAPGHHILSAGNTGTKGPVAPNSRYDYGTSMASPHVAGTLALMKQKNPSFSSNQLKDLLLTSGDPFASGKTLNTHDALYITSAFKDVYWGRTFYNEIAWMHSSGISKGWASGNTRVYKPVQSITRDQMAAFLYRMAGSPDFTPPRVSPFADVATGQGFYKEMAWMHARGISTGWVDGRTRLYKPGQAISRDQMAAFLYRMAGKPAYGAPSTSPFADVSTRQGFYKEMAWMHGTGISKGWDDGTYRPGAAVSRDVMAAFLQRFDQKF